jgi:predicted MFS family arabinose efflux permease
LAVCGTEWTDRCRSEQADPVPRSRPAAPGAGPPLAPVAATFLTIGVFIGAWTVVATEIERELDGGPGRLGLVLAGALGIAAVANTIAGALTERLGTTAALRLTLVAWIAGLGLGSIAPAPWGVALALAAAMSGVGAVDVVANVSATAALADRPGRLVRVHSVFNIGGATGATLAAVLVDISPTIGWRLAWVTAAVVAAVLLLATWRSELPAGRPGEQVPLGQGLRMLRDERLVPVAAAFALGATVESGVSTWGVLQLRGQLDAGLLVGAGGAVLGFLIGVVTRLAISGLQTARAARIVIVAGTSAATLGLAMLAGLRQPLLAATGLVLASAGISVLWPLLMSEVGRGRERPGAIVGALSTVGYLGIVIGPGLIGLVAGRWGVPTGLWLLATAAGSIPVVLWVGGRPKAPARRLS